MPDTGPCAPERTLVAVRAMVPVTHSPPNSAEAILAIPCATSSQLERCRRPVMLSATTADSRLSMEPSSANEKASGNNCRISAQDAGGSAGAGKPRGMPPKREPMVSTGRCSGNASTEASNTASSRFGQCGRNRRPSMMMPTVTAAMIIAAGVAVGSAWNSACSFGTMAAGSGAGELQAQQVAQLAGKDDRRRCRR